MKNERGEEKCSLKKFTIFSLHNIYYRKLRRKQKMYLILQHFKFNNHVKVYILHNLTTINSSSSCINIYFCYQYQDNALKDAITIMCFWQVENA